VIVNALDSSPFTPTSVRDSYELSRAEPHQMNATTSLFAGKQGNQDCRSSPCPGLTGKFEANPRAENGHRYADAPDQIGTRGASPQDFAVLQSTQEKSMSEFGDTDKCGANPRLAFVSEFGATSKCEANPRFVLIWQYGRTLTNDADLGTSETDSRVVIVRHQGQLSIPSKPHTSNSDKTFWLVDSRSEEEKWMDGPGDSDTCRPDTCADMIIGVEPAGTSGPDTRARPG